VWPAWRLILEGVATLHEIETHYNIVDIADANHMLDAYHEARNRDTKR